MRARRASVMSMRGCPRCGAGPGFACERPDGTPRVALHQERHSSAVIVSRQKPERRQKERHSAAPVPAEGGFYKSPEWRRLRYRALCNHGNACQCCGVKAAPGSPLHVDHIKPRSRYPELELNVSNLQILCEDCNLGKGGWDQTDWRRA